MGLFDYIHFDYEHPELKGKFFQTKEFDDPYMSHYRITEAGRLIHEDVVYEDHSDPSATRLSALRGCMTPVKVGEIDMNWHGYVHFGDWRAKFTDGNLVGVERMVEAGDES